MNDYMTKGLNESGGTDLIRWDEGTELNQV